MKFPKQITAIIFLLAASAQGDERSEWFSERRAWIEQAKSGKSAESMLNLARIVTGVGRNLDQASPEAKDLFYQAKAQLLSISGHAEYYRDKILQAQERAQTGGGSSLSEYDREIMYGIQTLKQLHSAEGVRVLGELLSNDWVPPGNETAPLSGKFVPLSVSARVVLAQFPLLDKPFTDPITQDNRDDALAAWRLWYEEIKSSKRTFRFEGDPTEYDLNGPAAKQKQERIARDRKRDSDRVARSKKSGRPSKADVSPNPNEAPKAASIAVLIASFLLLAGAVWYFSRGRGERL